MTDAEQLFWSNVRGRNLDGFKFRRQATIGPYIVDFLCAEVRLAVEIDGGQHGEENDRARSAFIEAEGYSIIRFWNNDVLGNLDGVLETIRSEIRRRRPSPNPLPQAGEG